MLRDRTLISPIAAAGGDDGDSSDDSSTEPSVPDDFGVETLVIDISAGHPQ